MTCACYTLVLAATVVVSLTHDNHFGWKGSMSDQEFQNTVDAMASLRDELISSPELARAYLVEAGILPTARSVDEHISQDA